MSAIPFQPLNLPDLEEQRVILAAAGLDVDDSVLGPPVLTLVPPPSTPRQPGRIRIKERDSISSWSKLGVCNAAGHDPDRFFPTRHSTLDDVESTKEICRGCPVRWQCLDYSVRNWEKLGIWGGYTEIERREVRRDLKRQIGRGLVDPSSSSSIQGYLEERWGGSDRPIRRGEGEAPADHPSDM